MSFQGTPAYVVLEEPGSGELILRVGGELDTTTRDIVEPAIMAAIASADSITIDLGELTFCDSTGIAMFIAAHEKAAADSTTLVFRHVGGAVRRVFKITGVDVRFGLAD